MGPLEMTPDLIRCDGYTQVREYVQGGQRGPRPLNSKEMQLS